MTGYQGHHRSGDVQRPAAGADDRPVGRHRAVDDRGSDGPTARPASAWNSSTMCLRTLHRHMLAEGWAGTAVELPLCAGEATRLPRRPPDLGVGRWR